VFGHKTASFSATNVMATVPDVVVEVVEADNAMRTPSAVGDTGFVMAGGDVGAEPLLAAGAAPGATPGATASKHKGKHVPRRTNCSDGGVRHGVRRPNDGCEPMRYGICIERRFLAKMSFKNSSFAGHRRLAQEK
jgi:hypothetical protein